MEWQAIVVCVSLLLGLGILITDKVSTEVVFLIELILFWNLNIITTEEALTGFSNKGLIAIGALYIVVYPLSNNLYLNDLFRFILKGKTIENSLIKVCSIVAILSAFLNNTPLVQLLTPIIRKHSRLNHYPISSFLMPISFSSIIGGTFTIIGTSTSMIIISLLPDNINIGFFDTATLALPFFLLFLVYNYFFNKRLLPVRSGLYREIQNSYFVNIKPKSETYKDTFIKELRINEDDIVGINDGGKIKYEIPEIINEYICIKTNTENMGRLIDNKKYEIIDLKNDIKKENIFYECVIGNTKEISRKSFELKYNCKILASRNGDNNIHKGTTLVIITTKDFYKIWKNTPDFYMISLFNKEEVNSKILPALLFLAMIIVTSIGIYPIEKSATTLVAVYLLFGILDIKDALKVINYGLLLVIGSSFGISKAMTNSGISEGIADLLAQIGNNWWLVYVIIQLFAQILTEVITNNAVAALMTQIVVDVCRVNGYDLKPFILGLMVSCSCSFVTPYGYATNLIIQGTGGYKFLDYLRFGTIVKIMGFLISFGVYFWEFL